MRPLLLGLALTACAPEVAVDWDGDGVPAGVDCDDGDAWVGAPASFYADADGDTWGTGEAMEVCAGPGLSPRDGDCDDDRFETNPTAPERCNHLDDDCDVRVDDGLPTSTWWEDADLADADTVITGDAATVVGRAVAIIPDTDGDGLDDLLLGVPDQSSALTLAGAALVFYGGVDSGAVEADEPDAWIAGETSSARLGGAVAGVSDANGDDLGELLLSEPASTAGDIYLFLGTGP